MALPDPGWDSHQGFKRSIWLRQQVRPAPDLRLSADFRAWGERPQVCLRQGHNACRRCGLQPHRFGCSDGERPRPLRGCFRRRAEAGQGAQAAGHAWCLGRRSGDRHARDVVCQHHGRPRVHHRRVPAERRDRPCEDSLRRESRRARPVWGVEEGLCGEDSHRCRCETFPRRKALWRACAACRALRRGASAGHRPLARPLVWAVLPARPYPERHGLRRPPLRELQEAASALRYSRSLWRLARFARSGLPPRRQDRGARRHYPWEGCQRRPRDGLLALSRRFRREGCAYDRPHEWPRDPRGCQHDSILRRILQLRRAWLGQGLGFGIPLERHREGYAQEVLWPRGHPFAGYLQWLPADGWAWPDSFGRQGASDDGAQCQPQVWVAVPRPDHSEKQLGDARFSLRYEAGYLGGPRRGPFQPPRFAEGLQYRGEIQLLRISCQSQRQPWSRGSDSFAWRSPSGYDASPREGYLPLAVWFLSLQSPQQWGDSLDWRFCQCP